MIAWDVLAGVALAAAAAAQLARWLRVLQREHYEPRAPVRFAARWWWRHPATRVGRAFAVLPVLLVAVAVARVVLGGAVIAVPTALYGLFFPVGLSVRGRTGALRWTARAMRVGATALVLETAVAASTLASARPWAGAAAAVVATPLLVGMAAAMMRPVEEIGARRYVARAAERLARVHPLVVAVTGSYGKTSTKNHLADLLGPDAVASPRSYNNRAGLSRAITEGLSDSTRVFVAEMGTYGPGEIRAMCAWCPPDVAVVTAIGPVHLERMRTLDAIDAAKHEVTERARVVVLNADDARLAAWVPGLAERGVRVVTAGESAGADVRVAADAGRATFFLGGRALASADLPAGVHPVNVALAAAAALEAGASEADVAARLGAVRAVESRSAVATAPSGVVVIDDTFNANPASAAASIALLARVGAGARVVVTPGLVELGPAAARENRALAVSALAIGARLVVVGETNARALSSAGPVTRVATRDDAVALVRAELGPGDAVLYLNDLPDHYP
jgi:UDP-N-acetylmuramoyl-tripeptide--D-alanyl-D-alanine ligase